MDHNTLDLEAIFRAARAMTSEAERAAYLDRVCQGDGALRQRLEQMLAAPHDSTLLLAGGSDGGLPDNSNAAIAARNASVLKSLGRGALVAPQIALRETSHDEAGPRQRTLSRELPPARNTGRYELFGEIARGGMGAIFKGRDNDLGRELAIKVLLDQHREAPDVVQRFVEEAQIGGQLQHPGIVPVYELGQFADRRPFISMKLVKGETLSALLDRRPDASAERAKFLGIFQQICQTMAYAHSRGVIHRDLKPANVMVGAFGEVQVMDWGLAKVLIAAGERKGEKPQAPQPPTSVVRTRRSMGSDTPIVGDSQTIAGSVLGTPAYMPPEQALGEVDQLDERADVFALGAILCEILTGRPPYVGADPSAVFRLATRGKLDDCFQRLDASGAETELLAIARNCLAAEPQDRPRDAGEVARRVTSHLASVAERLRTAEVERAAAEAKAAAERRARRRVLILSSIVVALIALAGAQAWRVQSQQARVKEETARREVRLRESVESALAQVRELQRADRLPEARAVLNRVAGEVDPAAPSEVKAMFASARGDLELVTRLENIRLNRVICGTWSPGFRAAAEAYEKEFRNAGFPVETDASGGDGALAGRIRESTVRDNLVKALDDWAMAAQKGDLRARLLNLARLSDTPGSWHDRFREPSAWDDRQSLEKLAAEAMNADIRPHLIVVLGWQMYELGADAAPLLTIHQRKHPGDFWLNYMLAHALLEQDKPTEAMGFWRAALAIRPHSALVQNNVGVTFGKQHDLNNEIDCYRRAIALDEKLALPHSNLGFELFNSKQIEESKKEFEISLQLDPTFPPAHVGRGLILRQQGDIDGARAELRRAWNSTSPKDPNRAALQVELQRTELIAALDARLASVIGGQYQPQFPREALELAEYCSEFKQRPLVAYRLYSIAMQGDPKEVENSGPPYHYNAACSAALAAGGAGDASALGEEERTKIRNQARAWLETDLAIWTKRLDSGTDDDRKAVLETLTFWKQDSDLSSIRAPAETTHYPTDEQAALKQLWEAVEALHKRAAE